MKKPATYSAVAGETCHPARAGNAGGLAGEFEIPNFAAVPDCDCLFGGHASGDLVRAFLDFAGAGVPGLELIAINK